MGLANNFAIQTRLGARGESMEAMTSWIGMELYARERKSAEMISSLEKWLP